MSTKDTSLDAYEELASSGTLQSQKEVVYQLLKELGPSTQREIEDHHTKLTGINFLLRCRFAPLEREGLIKPTGKRPCKVTGYMAYTWEADPKSPSLERPRSKTQEIKELKDQLERCARAETIEEVRRICGVSTENYTPPVLRLPAKEES